jgi:hypothetical protein
MRVTKLNNFEDNFKEHIESARNSEGQALRCRRTRMVGCFVSYHILRASSSERWYVCNLRLGQ